MRQTLIALAMTLALTPSVSGDPEGATSKCQTEAKACLRAMAHKLDTKAWVGIELGHDPSTHSLVIRKVVADSPAEEAGFLAGDVLASLNGISYTRENKAALKKVYAGLAPGDTALYTVLRDGREVEMRVELDRVPDNLKAQWIGHHMLTHHLDDSERGEGDPH